MARSGMQNQPSCHQSAHPGSSLYPFPQAPKTHSCTLGWGTGSGWIAVSRFLSFLQLHNHLVKTKKKGQRATSFLSVSAAKQLLPRFQQPVCMSVHAEPSLCAFATAWMCCTVAVLPKKLAQLREMCLNSCQWNPELLEAAVYTEAGLSVVSGECDQHIQSSVIKLLA